jgi:Spy/CpxP family protein refolding chaperone
MKKIILSALVLSLSFALKAQEIPERKAERPMMMHGQHKDHHGMGGMDMQKLNLTDAQKEQFKTQRESFRKQMEELKKNDNITVKEWKSRMETLKKDQKTKMQSILTSDQKAQLEKMKAEHKAMNEIDAKARMEKMKLHLGLTDEQAAKMNKNRTEMMEKMKALREDDKMDAEKKKEQMHDLMKKQKEQMKSILTEEQMKKLQEGRKQGHGGMHDRKPGKKEVI